MRAIEDTSLFAIKHQNFERLLRDNPGFGEVIVQELVKYQEELAQRKQELQEKGLLIPEEDETNMVVWVRKRLKTLFGF